MKVENGNILNDNLLKLKDYIRALKWWAKNLREPLVNGEYILFQKIVDNMTEELKIITKEIKKDELTAKK